MEPGQPQPATAYAGYLPVGSVDNAADNAALIEWMARGGGAAPAGMVPQHVAVTHVSQAPAAMPPTSWAGDSAAAPAEQALAADAAAVAAPAGGADAAAQVAVYAPAAMVPGAVQAPPPSFLSTPNISAEWHVHMVKGPRKPAEPAVDDANAVPPQPQVRTSRARRTPSS